MDNLKDRVNRLYNVEHRLTLEEYNTLLLDCVNRYEMAAVVFIYDHMKQSTIEPNEYTYSIIDKLHSKTVKQSNEIYIKNQNVGKLDPRRRIHKIMKGYNYSDNYNNAMKKTPKIIKDELYEATPRFGSKLTSEESLNLGYLNKTITFDTKVVT